MLHSSPASSHFVFVPLSSVVSLYLVVCSMVRLAFRLLIVSLYLSYLFHVSSFSFFAPCSFFKPLISSLSYFLVSPHLFRFFLFFSSFLHIFHISSLIDFHIVPFLIILSFMVILFLSPCLFDFCLFLSVLHFFQNCSYIMHSHIVSCSHL